MSGPGGESSERVAAAATKEVLELLGSGPAGLTSAEAARRRRLYGPNRLPEGRTESLLRRYLRQFSDRFVILLLLAALLTLGTYLYQPSRYNLTVFTAILAVILLNATISFLQEYRAERTMAELRRLLPRRCRVLRDGQLRELAVEELVPGDLIRLSAGDDVPADARLVQAEEFAVSQANLTGESEPVHLSAEPDSSREGRNLVFLGTGVLAGSGTAVVFATGVATRFGAVYRLTGSVRESPSPLQRQVDRLAGSVAAAAVILGVVLFVLSRYLGFSLVEGFLFALGVMVALVPEGLPATLSLSLAMGVRRLARQKALVKRLAAVETLGSTQAIVTDKTGTLTTGEMTAVSVFLDRREIRVSGSGLGPEGEFSERPKDLPVLAAIAALCGTAELTPPERASGRWRLIGDPTEGALLSLALKAGENAESLRRYGELRQSFPFSAERKRMTVIHGGATPTALVKGAPGEILERSTRVLLDGREVPLTPELRAEFVARNDAYAEKAYRVLALARKSLGPGPWKAEEVERELTLVGLVALADPPRRGVAEAVARAREAGIKIYMATGDYGLTARALAREIGLGDGEIRVVTGEELAAMGEAELTGILRDDAPVIFARVAPGQKLRLVESLQALGRVVAVTGDGVNDAPALKKADIGVAMGRTGTDVARAAATMVLLDDSFVTIVRAIELGRAIYANIRKFVLYVFIHDLAELLPYVIATVAGLGMVPLLALQVLAIDLGTEQVPSLGLGVEEPEAGLMSRPPREPSEPLLHRPLLERLLLLGTLEAAWAMGGFLLTLFHGGWRWGEVLPFGSGLYRSALTLTQAAIVVGQAGAALAVRREFTPFFRGFAQNPVVLGGSLLGVALMFLMSYWPPLNELLHTAPLAAWQWGWALSGSALLVLAEERRKATGRRGRDLAASHK